MWSYENNEEFINLPDIVQDAIGDFVLNASDGPEYTIDLFGTEWIIMRSYDDSTRYSIMVGERVPRNEIPESIDAAIASYVLEGYLKNINDYATAFDRFQQVLYLIQLAENYDIVVYEVCWESNIYDLGSTSDIANYMGSNRSPLTTFEITEEVDASTVNHPDHYGGADNPYEAIKVIDAWNLGFSLGNAVKYISRAGKKGDNAYEDIQKAAWYLNHWLENN